MWPSTPVLIGSAAAILALGAFASPAIAAFSDSHQSRLSASDGARTEIDGLTTALPIITITAMPGETRIIRTRAAAWAEDGDLEPLSDGWAWTAPDTPGLVKLGLTDGGKFTHVNAFVLTPFDNGTEDRLDGYRIGAYVSPVGASVNKQPPRGFIAYDDSLADIRVSPHFRLSQFLCKQQPGAQPKYLLVRPELLVKLEMIVDVANRKGWDADTLFVMSGYRTPWYNASIGNATTTSRHLYGDAADIYVDSDRDGGMDDLNGDGVVDRADAEVLAQLVETMTSTADNEWVEGGLSVYDANPAHGPFVHVDARGYPARW